MSTPTPLEAAAKQLRENLRPRLAETVDEVPAHLLLRLALLLDGDPVEHVLLAREGGRSSFSGTLLLLTGQLAVLVTASGAQHKPAPHHDQSIELQVWARRELTGVRLADGVTGADYRWAAYGRDQLWPHGTVVELTYRQQPEPLTFDDTAAGDPLHQLLPALARDLHS